MKVHLLTLCLLFPGSQYGMASLCPCGAAIFASSIDGQTYQWQVHTGAGFTNISDNGTYTGTGTKTLQLYNLPSSWYGYQYRCIADENNSNEYTLTFENSWLGSVDTVWENPANWTCGIVPD